MRRRKIGIIVIFVLVVVTMLGCSSGGMKHLAKPKQIILSSETKTETLDPDHKEYDAWYKACQSSWDKNLVQGEVVFASYLYVNEEDVAISPIEITFVYEEGVSWSQKGRPLEIKGNRYTFFPIGAELAAVTDDGEYTQEAFVIPFEPAQTLSKMASDWLEDEDASDVAEIEEVPMIWIKPQLCYNGKVNTQWFDICEPMAGAFIDGIGEVNYQNIEDLEIVGAISQYIEGDLSVQDELATNVEGVSVGDSVYRVELGNRVWLMIECQGFDGISGAKRQCFFGGWTDK